MAGAGDCLGFACGVGSARFARSARGWARGVGSAPRSLADTKTKTLLDVDRVHTQAEPQTSVLGCRTGCKPGVVSHQNTLYLGIASHVRHHNSKPC